MQIQEDSPDTAHQHTLNQVGQFHELLDAQAKLADLFAALENAREAVWRALNCNLPAPTLDDLGARLWTAHVTLNRRFREAFKRQDTTKTRNLSKEFLVFIKSSQSYYRRCVSSIARGHGIKEPMIFTEDALIKKFGLHNLDDFIKGQRSKAAHLCYDALISLGDLSRWRKQLLPREATDWKPARSYYFLAASMQPELSTHHNQLALTFTAEDDHFNALYHLYRSKLVQPEDACVESNLRREMKKILTEYGRNDLLSQIARHSSANSIVSLTAEFLLMHCAYASRNQLDQALPARMKFLELSRSLLRSGECEVICSAFARQMAMMNIAAEEWNPRFQCLNLRLCVIHFDAFSDELKGVQHGLVGLDAPMTLSQRAQSLLCPIRIYSLWMPKKWECLPKEPVDLSLQDAWESYATVLTLLANLFPVEQLPTADYILEEDEETRGFLLLMNEDRQRIWKNGLEHKPRVPDETRRLTAENESLVRIRDLLIDGLSLALKAGTPLSLDGTTFSCNVLLRY